MKKLLINAFGIGSVFTFIAMIVMTVCFKDKDNSRIKDSISGNEPASVHSRIGSPGENIKSQNVVAHSNTYSSSNNLGFVYESYSSDFSETYDPTDYADDGNGDSFDTGDVRGLNSSGNYNEEIKAADIIE